MTTYMDETRTPHDFVALVLRGTLQGTVRCAHIWVDNITVPYCALCGATKPWIDPFPRATTLPWPTSCLNRSLSGPTFVPAREGYQPNALLTRRRAEYTRGAR